MGKRKHQPIEKGVCKVPVVMQLEALECGAACLTMILAYYEKWVPLEKVRVDCGVSRDGSSASNVLKAARHYGLTATGYRMEPEVLRKEGIFPCIAHWEFNHFIVVNGFRGNKVYVNDPARGNYSMSLEEFDAGFTGVCLLFEPSETFQPEGQRKSIYAFAGKRLSGEKLAMLFSLLIAVITALLSVMQPAFSKVFVDHLLSQKDPQWLIPFLIFLGIFNIVMILMSGLQAIYNMRIDGKMAAVGSASYMWKVLRLPMHFFSQRMAGDIKERQEANASIAGTLIGTLVPLTIKSVMVVVYFVVMIRFSVLLTFVGLGALTISAIVSNYVSKKRINITRVSMRDQANLYSATVNGIQMVETIKASGAETGYFAKWSGYQAGVNAQQAKMTKVNEYLGMIPKFVALLADNAVLVIGVLLVMQGKFTEGMILQFQVFLTSFMQPAQELITANQTIQEMRTQMERVDDVMEYPEDVSFHAEEAEKESEESVDYSKLSGNVEMKDIFFGYAPLGKPLIQAFQLSVKPGASIAIVGASGSGKSTVAKLLSGLYQPWEGEIRIDGKLLSEIPRSVLKSSLAVVDQDIILFEDTVANNIKMWDDTIEDFEMILAARDANIHEDIMRKPDGYQHKLLEGGKDFSGGQRQRLEIARVLAQDPTIIIMDEATSALDARTEYQVIEAIRERGITCIVIAHRLSTIRSCDEIIVMQDGMIADRGTHSELMQTSELYQQLVTNE